jgi:hypothetical protein
MDLGPHPWRFKPGDREHAPGSLRTVQALVNTINHGVDDSLDRDGTLELWLDEFELPAGRRPLTGSDVARTKEVREALRALLWHNGLVDTDTAAAAATLERAARTAQLTIAFGGDSSELVPLDPGLDGALGQVVAIVYTSMADGSWQRMKACRRCGWAYYDHSRNHSSSWCSMKYCGNRTKTRAYRRRQR